MMKIKKLPMDELRISITSSCNMKCYYCHNEGNRLTSKLDINDIDSLINAAMKFGLKSIRLTGGEPMICNDIFSICSMIKEKYNLKIGINTNGIEIDKILELIDSNLIDRVVVGIDYFNNKISKNSPVGICSKDILRNIELIKKRGIGVTIATVFDNDYSDIEQLFNWALTHDIRIKILEKIDDEQSDVTSPAYIKIRDQIIDKYNLIPKIDPIFNELHGYLGGKRVVSFFHSHCRIRECRLCKNMHLRVMSSGKLKPCLLNTETEVDYKIGNVEKNIVTAIDLLGIPPK